MALLGVVPAGGIYVAYCYLFPFVAPVELPASARGRIAVVADAWASRIPGICCPRPVRGIHVGPMAVSTGLLGGSAAGIWIVVLVVSGCVALLVAVPARVWALVIG